MMSFVNYYLYGSTVFVTFSDAIMPSLTWNMVYPHFNPAPYTYVPITRVNAMNVEQTANWIQTLASSKGWSNSEYVKRFRNENINGIGLQHLSNEKLIRLGVQNPVHRQEILSTIRSLYLGVPVACAYLNSDERWSVSGPTSYTSPSGITKLDHKIDSTPLLHKNDCNQNVGSVKESCSNIYTHYSTSATSSLPGLGCCSENEMDRSSMPITRARSSVVIKRRNSISHAMNLGFPYKKPVNSRSLLVTLDSKQDNDPERSIRNRFRELNIPVEIDKLVGKENVFVLIFSDCTSAQDALLRSVEIGYSLRCMRPARPSPKNPRPFISLRGLKILSGKSLKSNEIDWLPKYSVVTVNQMKGCRARLIREKTDGSVKVIGWVSFVIDGVECLAPVDDM